MAGSLGLLAWAVEVNTYIQNQGQSWAVTAVTPLQI